MKDSGVEWIGEIPEGWRILRLGQCSVQVKVSNEGLRETNLLSLSYGKIVRKNIETTFGLLPASFESYTIVQPGDTVLRLTDLQNDQRSLRSGYVKETGIVTSAYVSLRPNRDTPPRFLQYSLHAYDIIKGFYGMGAGVRQGLNWAGIKHLGLCIPGTEEAERIADFLDAQAAAIDASIAKTQESIEEYKKLKQAVITQAVTKGICPGRVMKDSGVEWVGEIPTEWSATRLKHCISIRKIIAGEPGHTVLAITQKGIVPKDIASNEGQIAADYSHYQIVHVGDFAMNHMDLLTGWADISKYEGVTSPDYRVFVLTDYERWCPQYLIRVIQSCYKGRVFYGLGQGVSGMGRWRLPADMFLNFLIPAPGLSEQQEIAAYLDEKCAAIDTLIEKKQAIITELEAYKKSLIYEYVTGKKEVPVAT